MSGGDGWGAHPTDTLEVIEGGRVVSFPDADEAINRAIATFQDQLDEKWNYQSLPFGMLVRDVRAWSHDLWDRFMPKEWDGALINRPPLLFRFQREGDRVLGHYRRGRNDIGLRWEISINP